MQAVLKQCVPSAAKAITLQVTAHATPRTHHIKKCSLTHIPARLLPQTVMIAVAIVVIFGIVQSIRFVWQFAFDLAHHARDAATEYVLDIRDTDARRQAATE